MMDPLHPWVDPGEMRRMAEALLLPPAPQASAPDGAGFGGDFVGFTPEQMRAALTASVSLRAPTATAPPPLTDLTRSVSLRAEHRDLAAPAAMVPPVIVAPAAMEIPANIVVVTPIAPTLPEPVRNFQHMAGSHVATLPSASPAPTAPSVEPAPPAAPVKMRGPFLERMARFRDGLHGQFASKGMFILDKEGSVIFDEANHTKLHFMARSLAMAAKKSNDGPGNVHVKVGSTTMLEVIPVDTVFGRMVLGILMEQSLSTDDVYRITKALQVAVAPPKP